MAEHDCGPETQQTTYKALFADGEPIRVKDIAKATAASRPPADDENGGGGGGTKLSGSRSKATSEQLIKAIAAMEQTWQLAVALQEEIDHARLGTRGRKPEYTAFDAIVYVAGTYVYGGSASMHTLVNPDLDLGRDETSLWRRINESLDRSRPERPEQRLSPGFGRFCHDRVRKDYLTGEVLHQLERLAMRLCVDTATHIGQFRPSAGTYTRPDRAQMVYGDGCKVNSLYNNSDPNKINRKTGKPRRCDPEAFAPEAKPGEPAIRPHYEYCMLLTHTKFVQERIVLGTYIKGEAQRGKSDATLTVEVLMQVLEECPHIINGLYGFAYDMMLSAKNRERLLKAGIQPISKLSHITKEQPVIWEFDEHHFAHRAIDPDTGETTDIVALTAKIIAVNGTATVIWPDGDGEDCYVPLTITRRIRTQQRSGGYAVSIDLALPHHPILPTRLHGASITMRADTPQDDLKTDKPTLRPGRISSFPESDPHFFPTFGFRQDAESTFRDHRSLLRDKRCITVSRDNNRFQALGFQIMQLARVMLANSKRTGDYHTDTFGQYLVPDDQLRPPPQTLRLAA